jgi:hypothetical protein
MIISSLAISHYTIDVLNIIGGFLGFLGAVYMAVDLLNLKQNFQRLTIVLLQLPLILLPLVIVALLLGFFGSSVKEVDIFILLMVVIYVVGTYWVVWSSPPPPPQVPVHPLSLPDIRVFIRGGVYILLAIILGLSLGKSRNSPVWLWNLHGWLFFVVVIGGSFIIIIVTSLIFSLSMGIPIWLSWSVNKLSSRILGIVGAAFIACGFLMVAIQSVADFFHLIS